MSLPPLTTYPLPQTITITTTRLLLRAAVPADAPGLHAIFSDPDVMRYWSTLPHTTLAQTSAWLDKMLASPQNGVTEFIICVRTTPSAPASASAASLVSVSSPTPDAEVSRPSQVIGKIGIWRSTELGFLL